MSTRIWTFSLLAVLSAAQPLVADDSAQALYDQNCVSCHGTEVYTREERKIDSLSSLESQVRRCETALELRWFDDEISAVTQLLNDRFYHFAP
jgi:hypothetical protein